MHCGDDVRYRPLQKAINSSLGQNLWNEKPSLTNFINKFSFQFISQISGKLISMRDQSTFQFKPLCFFQFPQEKILDNPKKAKKVPLLLHCPSNRLIKGTDIVIEAIKLLKQEGFLFEFEIIENSSNSYALERLKEAEVLIDQLGIWVARLAVDAMGVCNYRKQIDKLVDE